MNRFDTGTTSVPAADTNRFSISDYVNPATLDTAAQPKISQGNAEGAPTYGNVLDSINGFLNRYLQPIADAIKPYLPGPTEKEKLAQNPVDTTSLINTSFNLAGQKKAGKILTPEQNSILAQGQKAFAQKTQDLVVGFTGGDTQGGQGILDELINRLAIEKDPAVIANELRIAEVPEHLIEPASQHIANLETPGQVKNYLSQLSTASPKINPFATPEGTGLSTEITPPEKSIIPQSIDQFNSLTPQMQSNVFEHLSPALKEQIYNLPAGAGNESQTALDEYANKIINGELKIKTGPEFKQEAYEGLGQSQYMRSFTKAVNASPIDEIVQRINDRTGGDITASDLLDRMKQVADAKATNVKVGLTKAEKAAAGITPDIEQMAATDWEQNFAEKYQQLSDRSTQLAKEIKTAPGADKPTLQAELESVLVGQQKIEEDFTGKWRAHAGIPETTPGPETTDISKTAELSKNTPGPTENPVPLSKSAETLLQLPEEEKLSLRPIIQQVEKTVKDKVHIMDYFQTPEFVLKKLGLSAESDLLHTAYHSFRTQIKVEIGKIIDWKKEVAGIPDASKNIFKYLDGQNVKLSTTERLVGNQIREYLAEWADKLDLPKDNRIQHYITHIFEPDFLQKEFDPELARIITDRVAGSVYDPFLEQRLGKMGYKQDVFGALDAYVKRATRKVNMDPALEALKKAAGELDVESGKYIARLSHRINLRPTEVDNLVDNLFKSIFGYKFGTRPVARISNTVRQMVYRGTLGLNLGSALRNLTQGVNTYAKLGEKYTAVGYAQLFSRLTTRNLDELFKNGILDDALIQDRKIGIYKSIMQKADPILFKFFDLAEKINRGSAYYGAKAKFIAGGATEAEAIDKAVRLVRETQFAFGNLDSPVIMSSDLAKLAFQLQTYNIKEIEFLKNMVKNKEWGGIIRFIAGSLVTIGTIGKLFGMKLSDVIPTVRLGGSPSGSLLTGLSDLVNGNAQTKASAKKQIGNAILDFLPAGAQLKKTVQGIGAYQQGKDTTPTGKTRFTIPQNPASFIQNALFGKSSTPEAQQYYNSFGSKKSPAKISGNRFSK